MNKDIVFVVKMIIFSLSCQSFPSMVGHHIGKIGIVPARCMVFREAMHQMKA